MKRFTVVLAMVCAFAFTILAQSSTGRLIGTVSGPDGALPGATVTIKDSKTGKELVVTSSSDGSFNFPLLDQGEYTVRATANGFKTVVTTITIQVAQEYSLPIALTIGDVSETVTVTAGAELINSTNAEISSTLTNRQITELPLATRNPLALILTQAGSASNPSQLTSINGGRTASTNITRDGVNIQDNFIRSNATDFAPGRPSVDNVEEFTLTAQSSVDSGFGSAQVNFVTPRGGNEFHGGAWEYNRNSIVGANSWFANASGNYAANHPAVLAGFRKAGEEINPRPFRNRNQYGAKVSGPIWKDRIFFFAYAERLKDIVQAGRVITVLTDTARQGTFRYIAGGTTYSANIFCPGCFTTGASGVAAPTSTNSLVSSTYLAGMPVGNSFEVGDGINTTGYRFFQQANTDRDSLTGRLDYDINDKNNVNFVIDYNYEENLRNDQDTVSVTPIVLQPARNVVYSGGWRYSPTASLSNEFRIGRFFSVPDFFRTDDVPQQLFVPTLISALPTFLNQGRQVKTFNLQDTATWLVGNHSVRFGAQFQKVDISAYNDAGIRPIYSFGLSVNGPQLQAGNLQAAAGGPALTPAQQTTARNLYALLGGVIGAGQQTFNATSQTSGYVSGATNLREFEFSMFAPYILDQWKVNKNLTLNAGVRWDYQTALRSKNGLYWEPTITDGRSAVEAVLDPAGTYQFIGGNSGKENTFYKPDYDNFAPSFGVAWSPGELSNKYLRWVAGEDFVIRGGYRKSFVNDELVRAPDNALSNHPGFSTTTGAVLAGVTTAIDDRFGSPSNAVLSSGPFVNSRAYTTNNTTAFSRTGTVFAIDPEIQVPSQNDYQVSVQRRFGKWVAEARYVGGFSKDMLRTVDYNQLKLPTQFLTDFNTVRANVLNNCGQPVGTAPTALQCAAGAPMFLSMTGSGGVTPTNALGTLVQLGMAAELAWQQIILGNIPNPNVSPVPAGSLRSQFLPNPNTGVANVLENGGVYYYNAGQFELRRQINQGLYVQANYTFSKELTNAIGTAQTRVEAFLDNNNRDLDYTRADYDQTHVFNVNAIYELPFGKGRKYWSNAGWVDHVVGGWQLGLVWRAASGAPITFTDARGTLNRTGRSGRQTAMVNVSLEQLQSNIGVYNTPCGIYFVNPTVININQANLAAGNCSQLNTGVPAGTVGGAASSGWGQATFANQIFFNNGPNQTGNLRRAVVNGPAFISADVSLLKNFRITERVGFQIRGEAYNFTNTPYFAPGQIIDINSTTFGRVTGSAVGSRVVQFAGRLSF